MWTKQKIKHDIYREVDKEVKKAKITFKLTAITNLRNPFIRNNEIKMCLTSFCPECGGELKYDPASNNFICKSCGLFASKEKIEELRDKAETEFMDQRRRVHDDYLEWWQSSKKDKQKQ